LISSLLGMKVTVQH